MIQNLFGKRGNFIFLVNIVNIFSESKIALTEKGEIMTTRIKVANTFNSYFASFTESLDFFN